MKKELLLCDVCGAETHLDTICVAVDRKMDAAGSMDDECERVDVCGVCLRRYVLSLTKNNHDRAQQLVNWVKAKGK
jgi:hypothetical protein